MSDQTSRADSDVMRAILNPASIAIVGASNDPTKLTGRPIAHLQRYGYSGAIYPINPRSDIVAGLKSYPAAADLPEAPDLGMVLVGANRVAATPPTPSTAAGSATSGCRERPS